MQSGSFWTAFSCFLFTYTEYTTIYNGYNPSWIIDGTQSAFSVGFGETRSWELRGEWAIEAEKEAWCSCSCKKVCTWWYNLGQVFWARRQMGSCHNHSQDRSGVLPRRGGRLWARGTRKHMNQIHANFKQRLRYRWSLLQLSWLNSPRWDSHYSWTILQLSGATAYPRESTGIQSPSTVEIKNTPRYPVRQWL